MKIDNPIKIKFPLILKNLDEYKRFQINASKQLKLNNYHDKWFPPKFNNEFPCVVEPIYHYEEKDLILRFEFDKDYFYYKIMNKVIKMPFEKQKEIFNLIK